VERSAVQRIYDMKQMHFTGKIWVLSGQDGRLIEDIDTDQIYHNAFLHITELEKMGEYACGNLEGWKDFPQRARPGDMIVVGRNFGAGSSRQQAVDCFLALKISLIIAPSYGAIYFRNAVNSGFPVLKSIDVERFVKEGKLETGDRISMDVLSGECRNENKDFSFDVLPMSDVQHSILQAGGLFRYGKALR
jgi:3-isopropylmalate/(R)-2-methylmalate dehydratase small subunit